MSGFIQLPRGLGSNPAFKNDPFSRYHAFVWLVEKAAWRSTKIDIMGRSVAIARGQFCCSIRDMAETWRWTKDKVDRFLSRLETETLIRRSGESGRTVISIVEYDTYQGGDRDQPNLDVGLFATPPLHQDDTTTPAKEETNNLITTPSSEAANPKKARARFFIEGEPMHPDFRRIAEKYDDVDIEFEWENFRDWHLSKGKATASMGGSASTWMRRGYGQPRPRQAEAPLLGLAVDNTKRPVEEPDDVVAWRRKIKLFIDRGYWDSNDGERPGHQFCEVPKWIIAQYPDAVRGKVAL